MLNFEFEHDQYLLKIRKEAIAKDLTWKQLAYEMNCRFKGMHFNQQQLSSRHQEITAKLSKQEAIEVFAAFYKYEINFKQIARVTGKALNQVKRQVISILANNVWKIFFITRKRKISNLQKNYLSNDNIKSFVILMLKAQKLKLIKQKYLLIWRYIFKFYQDDKSFQNLSNEEMKDIYSQVISIANIFKIVEEHKEEDLQLESSLLLEEAQNNKRNAETIVDLVSENGEIVKIQQEEPMIDQNARNEMNGQESTAHTKEFNGIFSEMMKSKNKYEAMQREGYSKAEILPQLMQYEIFQFIMQKNHLKH